MKNFLKGTLFLLLMAVATLADAQPCECTDIEMTRTSGRLPRLGIGVNVVGSGAATGYTLNGKGDILYRTTGFVDSSTVKVDTNRVILSNNLEADGAVNFKLVGDSVTTLQAITSVTTTAPTQALVATTSVTATTPFVQIVSSGTALKVVGGTTVTAAGSDTATLTNFPEVGNPDKFLEIIQKATSGGADTTYVIPMWQSNP